MLDTIVGSCRQQLLSFRFCQSAAEPPALMGPPVFCALRVNTRHALAKSVIKRRKRLHRDESDAEKVTSAICDKSVARRWLISGRSHSAMFSHSLHVSADVELEIAHDSSY